jgi:uncharacterized membrane protein
VSGPDPRLSKTVTAHSVIMAALSFVHSLRTQGLRRTLLFAALGNAIPILGELLAIHVLKVIRHHIQPQSRGVPLAIVLGWYNVGYGTLAAVNSAFNDGDKPRATKSLIPTVALVATSLDLLLDPFGLDVGLWEWSEGGPYAPEVKGPNGKRGIPVLNFAGWIALTSGVMLAYQRLRPRGDVTDAAELENGCGSSAERSAALLLLSYYLPAAVWAMKQERRKYLLYSAPFATTLCAALKGRPAAS